LCAFADEKKSINEDDIMTAVAELDWQEHESNTGLFEKLRQVARRHGTDSHVTEIEVRANGQTESVQTYPPGRIIVGRSPDNEIYIKGKFVSRHHAQLVSDDNGCVIEYLNSTNGVFIGEKQVKKYRLKDGDIVSLGVHELVYRDIRNINEVANDDNSSEESNDGEIEDVSATGEQSV
jgi:pSer/pThr/pTyr-binding forkhead associated (FHA) protein